MGAASRRQRWHLVYFALGAFNVVSVGAAVALSHRILGVYRASIAENHGWSQRAARYAELGALATEANSPGNDVFETRAVAREEARLRAAVERFAAVHREATREVHALGGETAARLAPGLATAGRHQRAMAAEARAIFEGFRRDDPQAAGRHMATMDRELALTQRALDGLRVTVQAVQRANFARELSVARRAGAYASAIVGLVALMVLFVVAYGVKLFKLFAHSQDLIERRNADMRALLDTVSQGFVNLDASGRLAPERSAAFTQWFGPHREGARIAEVLAASDPEVGAWMELAWESLAEGVLPVELCLEQLPKRVQVAGRTLSLEYRPTLRGGSLDSVLLVVSDLSAELARERAEASQRELLAVFERFTRDRRGLLGFFAETEALLGRLEVANDVPLAQVRRDIHTLKGNAGFQGLARLVATCHEVETRLAAQGELQEADRAALRAAWAPVRETLRSLGAGQAEARIEIGDDEHRELLAAVEGGAAPADLARRIRAWRLEPLRERFARFADLARDLGRRLGKGEVGVSTEDQGIRVPAGRLDAFWGAFVHLVRNAVDHGLETPGERARTGKAAPGRLWLRAERLDDRFVIAIEDDGRGIAWDRLAARARELGRPHATRADLIDALFADGISTTTEATEFSGRGVGSGAVRAACVALGGAVEVRSEPGQGARFAFTFAASLLEAGPGEPVSRAA